MLSSIIILTFVKGPLLLKCVLMLNISSLKKFPFAEKYLLGCDGLNLRSLSKPILKRVLNGITIDDVVFINKLCQWKESVIQGDDMPCPIDKFDFIQRDVKRSKLSLTWKITERICTFIVLPIVIIIGFFIWGNLEISRDYHIFIIIAIIVVVALIIRLAIHIKLIRTVRLLERLFPFAMVNRKVSSKLVARSVYLSILDTSYDKYNQYFSQDISCLIRLNVYIEVYYALLKNAISLYPDKILLYYKYGENRSAVYEYKYERRSQGFRSYTEKIICGYINIFDILKGIDKEQNLKFISSVISRSKVENILDLRLSVELEEYFYLRRDHLLSEGEFTSHTNEWIDKPIFKNNDTYKFRRDKYFRRYVVALSIAGTLLIGFYPSYFRYHYVKDKIAENEYKMLLEDYDANYDLLYSLEAVDIKVTVNNSMVYNNHVGHSWECYNSINGTKFKKKTIISYHYGDPITIVTKIIENDTIEDVSLIEKNMNFSESELKEGVDVSIESYVYENRGKYSGCHAKWNSKYHIQVLNPDKPIYKNIEVSPREVLQNYFKSL